MTRFIGMFAGLLLAGEVAVAAPPAPELDALIEATMKDWQVPGAAVAIVRGEDVQARGYGLRDRERTLPATEKTLFRIGSVTKSFTAAGVAALATQGKLEWNRPVSSYLPEFELHTADLTAQVTPVDMLSHRTGLPRHDAVWYYNRDWTREEFVRRMRYLEPNKPLREAWQYNNFMYMAAGYLTGRILGTTWEQAIDKLIFTPLGMTATNVDIKAMQANPDHAEPYQKDKKEVVQHLTEFYASDEFAPAGMINSNAEEMGRYLAMLMNGGTYRGTQVLARGDVQKMTTPQMVVGGPDPRYPEMGDNAYGLALSITSFRGHRMIHHGGAIDGFRAHMVWLPEPKLGIVVLSNLGGVGFVVAMAHELFDRLLGLPPANWSARYLDDMRKAKAATDEAEKRGLSPRKTGTQPSHPLADYVGHYEHPGYGTVQIGQSGRKDLRIKYGFLDTALAHYHYDSFEFVTNPVAQSKQMLRFETDFDGEIVGLVAPLEPLGAPIRYVRVADPQMRTAAFLRPLTGKYQLGANVVDIVLRDNGALAYVLASGAALELEPLRGTTFRVRDRAGWTLEFRKGRDGAVGEAVLHTPGASSVLARL